MHRSDDSPPVAVLERGHEPSRAKPEPPHIIAGRAWIAIRTLFRAHAQLARLEGAHLELLLRKRWYASLGFGSFKDFVIERLQLSPRTAKRRVALSRVCNESVDLALALDAGRLTPCRVLALSRLRTAPDLASWIAIAEDCTVRQLETLVANHLAEEAVDTDLLDESAGESGGAEPPGRRVTFAAPVSAAVTWEHAMEMARRVLGWEAPPHRCIEAVLAETATEFAEESDSSGELECPGESAVSANAHPQDDFAPLLERHPRPKTSPLLKVTRQQLDTLQRTIQDVEREMQNVISMARPMEDDPDRSIMVLKELQHKDRTLRLLFARLLRDADDASVVAFFGHATATDFLISRLKVSKRTAARLMSETWTFEGRPGLAEAFASGRIGLGEAYLVNRISTMSTEAAFIERAEAVTHLQFEREVRFLERFAEYLPSLRQQFYGPLPLPGLSKTLVGCLRELGWAEPEILEHLSMHEGEGDPAVDPLLMDQLEGLLDLVAVALEQHDMALMATVPTLAPESSADSSEVPTLAPASSADSSEVPTLALTQKRKAKLASLFSAESEALPMLAPGDTRDPHARTTISFWAPDALIEQWTEAIRRVQFLHGALPTWAAALFLVGRAVAEWERVDPSRRPTDWKIFERDQWRCQAPGCSSRRRLEAHHIIFRSQNGSDDPDNLITLCHGHHRRGIHEGYLAVSGSAPSDLRWRLGGTPHPAHFFHGSLRLSHPVLSMEDSTCP